MSIPHRVQDVQALKKLPSSVHSVFEDAIKAHNNAVASGSRVAKYNGLILRKLVKAFALDPNFDLLSKLPSNYS